MTQDNIEKLKKWIKYLNDDITILGIKSTRQKFILLIISTIIACTLISTNVIKFKRINSASKIVKMIPTNSADNFITTYDILSKTNVEKHINDNIELYENDLKYTPFDENSSHSQSLKQIDKAMKELLGKSINEESNEVEKVNLQNEVMNYDLNIDKIKKMSEDHELRLKTTKDSNFAKQLIDVLNTTDSKVVYKHNNAYLIQKIPGLDKDLESISKLLLTKNYIIYNKTHAIGTLNIKNENNTTKLMLYVLNPFDFKLINKEYQIKNITDFIKLIPNGYPNTSIIYKDGTIEITDMINNITNTDPYDINSLVISSIRLVASDSQAITSIQQKLKKFEMK